MKLKVKKTLIHGKYLVNVETFDFTEEENQKMRKFGAPNVELLGQRVIRGEAGDRNFVDTLALNDIKDIFLFNDELQALNFATQIRTEIEIRLSELKSKNDSFTDEDVYEL